MQSLISIRRCNAKSGKFCISNIHKKYHARSTPNRSFEENLRNIWNWKGHNVRLYLLCKLLTNKSEKSCQKSNPKGTIFKIEFPDWRLPTTRRHTRKIIFYEEIVLVTMKRSYERKVQLSSCSTFVLWLILCLAIACLLYISVCY